MASPVLSTAAGANAGSPAVSTITTNSRVKTQSGFVSLQTDVPQFAGPPVTGAWLVAGSRVFVQQVPVVPQTGTGIAIIPPSPSPSTVPMSVTLGDARVQAT